MISLDKLSRVRGIEEFSTLLDEAKGWPPGTTAKMMHTSELYEREIRRAMSMRPNATRAELRHTYLPAIVERVYKDWSPPKQEFLVREGVEIWFDPDKNWAGFHEQCQKRVHKQGYKSGPGDRVLFGWTVEEGDAFLSEDQTVHWTEDEGEEGAEEEAASLDNDDDNVVNKGDAGMTSFAAKLKAAKRGSKSRGRDKEGKNEKGKSNASHATAKPQGADSGDEEEKSGDEESRSKKQQLRRLTRSATKREREAASQAEPEAKKGRKSVTQSATGRRTAASSRRIAKIAKISKT